MASKNQFFVQKKTDDDNKVIFHLWRKKRMLRLF